MSHGKRRFQCPVIERSDPIIPPRRAAHYNAPKLIFAKLASSPEVFFDEFGDFAGLNVNFAFMNGDAAFFVLGQLNSVIGEWIYRQLFGALSMSGSYLQYQSPQIRAWPVVPFDEANSLHRNVATLARSLQTGGASISDLNGAVAECLQLSSREFEKITGSLQELRQVQSE